MRAGELKRKYTAISKIVDFWREDERAHPRFRSEFTGWGEPFCFACGWLVPGDPTWEEASPWLDRAHLKDHVAGGESTPPNLVMPLPPVPRPDAAVQRS